MTLKSSSLQQYRRGYTFALVSSLILSTTAILIRYLTQYYGFPVLVLSFWRAIICSFCILIILAIFKPGLLHVDRKDYCFLVLYGFILAAFNASWSISIVLNGAAISTVLEYSSAAFTALLGRWLLKERLSWIKILAIVLTLAGCVAISGMLDQAQLSANLPGIAFGIFSGLCYAIYSLTGRFSSQRGISPWTAMPYIFAIASIFLFGINIIFAGRLTGAPATVDGILWREGSSKAWIILFILSSGPTILGFGSYLVSLSCLPSSTANLLMTSEPIFTMVTAYIFLGERMTGYQMTGSLLIIIGVVFIRLMEGRMIKKEALPETILE